MIGIEVHSYTPPQTPPTIGTSIRRKYSQTPLRSRSQEAAYLPLSNTHENYYTHAKSLQCHKIIVVSTCCRPTLAGDHLRRISAKEYPATPRPHPISRHSHDRHLPRTSRSPYPGGLLHTVAPLTKHRPDFTSVDSQRDTLLRIGCLFRRTTRPKLPSVRSQVARTSQAIKSQPLASEMLPRPKYKGASPLLHGGAGRKAGGTKPPRTHITHAKVEDRKGECDEIMASG